MYQRSLSTGHVEGPVTTVINPEPVKTLVDTKIYFFEKAICLTKYGNKAFCDVANNVIKTIAALQVKGRITMLVIHQEVHGQLHGVVVIIGKGMGNLRLMMFKYTST